MTLVTTARLHRAALRFTARRAGSGPHVILVHGFPDTPATWDGLVPPLARAGYAVTAPTLRGYEPSSQPGDGDYGLEALAQDVLAWMDNLGTRRAHLVGHDWGATIAYAAAALAPDRVASLATLAVPHPGRFAARLRDFPGQMALSRYILFFQLPGIAEFVARRKGFAYLEGLWRSWSPGWEPPTDALDAMRRAFASPGVLRAALAYYRQAAKPKTPAGRRAAELMGKPIQVPTLAIGGLADRCIDPTLFATALDGADFPAGLEVKQLPGIGHFPHLEAPEAVTGLLLDWLARNPGG